MQCVSSSPTWFPSLINNAASLAQAMQAIPATLPHLPEAMLSQPLTHTSLSTAAHQALQHLKPCHKLNRLQHQPAMLSMRPCVTRLTRHIEPETFTEHCSFANQYVLVHQMQMRNSVPLLRWFLLAQSYPATQLASCSQQTQTAEGWHALHACIQVVSSCSITC